MKDLGDTDEKLKPIIPKKVTIEDMIHHQITQSVNASKLFRVYSDSPLFSTNLQEFNIKLFMQHLNFASVQSRLASEEYILKFMLNVEELYGSSNILSVFSDIPQQWYEMAVIMYKIATIHMEHENYKEAFDLVEIAYLQSKKWGDTYYRIPILLLYCKLLSMFGHFDHADIVFQKILTILNPTIRN